MRSRPFWTSHLAIERSRTAQDEADSSLGCRNHAAHRLEDQSHWMKKICPVSFIQSCYSLPLLELQRNVDHQDIVTRVRLETTSRVWYSEESNISAKYHKTAGGLPSWYEHAVRSGRTGMHRVSCLTRGVYYFHEATDLIQTHSVQDSLCTVIGMSLHDSFPVCISSLD